jgi:anti-sigma factor ChrR (cupin superfamily)
MTEVSFMNRDHPAGEPAELAALYAAGALPPEAGAAFEAHLQSGCAACRAEVEKFGPVVAALGAAINAIKPSPPPAAVRAALLQRIAAEDHPPAASPLRRAVAAAPGPQVAGAVVLQRASEAAWQDTPVPGVTIRTLFADPANDRFTALVRMAPGMSYPEHVHHGPEECLVLEGDVDTGATVLQAGDYLRMPAGSRHARQSTRHGCLLLITSSMSDEFLS